MKKLILILFLLSLSNISFSQSGWYVVASNIGYNLTGIYFIDGQTGWVCVPTYPVYKSTDGGSTWLMINQGAPIASQGICFSDASVGKIAAGNYSGGALYPIWYTGNGGLNWMSVAYWTYQAANFRSVTYSQGSFWYCGSLTVGGTPPVEHSFIGTQGNEVLFGHAIPLNRIRAGLTEPWTVGNQGLVYRSTSQVTVVNPSANLTGVSFHDINTGYVVGGTFMYKTTNYGGNWNRIYPLTPAGTYNDVYFANKDTGWVACVLSDGITGAMLFTSNGGTSWVQQYSGLTGSEICFVNNQTGWVLCGNSVLKTTSGGNPGVPNIPSPSSPPNSAVGLPLADTISWSISPGATSYRLQIATDSNFASLYLNDSTISANTRYVAGFLPLTNYWWRVNASSSSGSSSWSTVWKFKTLGTAGQVTLIVPVNNSVNIPTTQTFRWSKAIDQTTKLLVSNYWFEMLSDTITNANLLRDSSLTDTSRTVTGMLTSTTYYWRVKAKNQIGWGNFSSRFKFTTVPAVPAAPSLVAPANNSTGQSLTPQLDWSVVSGTNGYRVQVSTDSTFASTAFDSSNVIRDSIIIPTGKLMNNTKYYWRVNATNAGGTGPWSAVWNFRTSLLGITNIPGELPVTFRLYTNYPNPFNPITKIKFDIPKTVQVSMQIYNVLGEVVMDLVNETSLSAGSYKVEWNASDYASGIYYYRITAGNFTDVKKMVLIK